MLNFLKNSKKQTDPAVLFKRQLMLRFWLFFGLILVTVVALFLLSRSINDTVTSVKALRGEHKWLITNNGTIASIFTDRAKAKEMSAEINKIFPRAVDVPGIVIPQIQKLATTKQVNITITIDQGGDKAYEGLPVVPLSFNGSGTFKDIVSFFGLLESSALRVLIKSFSLLSGQDGSFIAQGAIRVYVQQY